MLPFIETLTRSLGITLTGESIQLNAKVAMGNVLFLIPYG